MGGHDRADAGEDPVREKAGEVAGRVERQIGDADREPAPETGSPREAGPEDESAGPPEQVADEIGGNPADSREDLRVPPRDQRDSDGPAGHPQHGRQDRRQPGGGPSSSR